METALSPGEIELLIDGLSDDIALDWVLIHLGIRGNPPADPGPPTSSQVDAAFSVLDRLSLAGLVEVGRIEYVDGGPPGRMAPVRHVGEPMAEVKTRVVAACASGAGWEWACWVINTAEGDRCARKLLASRTIPWNTGSGGRGTPT